MGDPAPDELTTCPYNDAHQIEYYRMQTHLEKCRKQYPNSTKESCPIDSTHIVNSCELDYHIKICSKRALLDGQIYVMDNDYRPAVEAQEPPPIQSEENWNDDVSTPYVPDMNKKGAHIIRKIRGATPSERKKARIEGIMNFKPHN